MTQEIWYELAVIVIYKQLPLFDWISPIGVNLAYFTKIKPALANYMKFQKVAMVGAVAATGSIKIDAVWIDHILNTITIG